MCNKQIVNMTTLEKLNKIAKDLFEVNYVNLSNPQEIEVFAHFLAKYAVSVQPKWVVERYLQLLER